MVSGARSRRVIGTALSLALLGLFVALLVAPSGGSAQTCTSVGCTVYAYTNLNLRKGPSITAAILGVVPRAAAVTRADGAVTSGYAPVTYNGVTGWVVALGLVASPSEALPPGAPVPTSATTVTTSTTPVPTVTSSTTSSDTANRRVTLAPLMLRGGSDPTSDPILVIPEGAAVTLTREGAENGYVTVNYNGTTGWAYADLLG
jgi:uncharacterized protein YraI